MRDPTEQRDAVVEFLITTAAMRAGLLEKIAEAPYDARGLARVTGLDRRLMERFLGALEHYGVVTRTPFGYALTPAAAAAYRESSGTAHYMQLLAVDTARGLLKLPAALKSGEPVAPLDDDPIRLRNFVYAQMERPADVLDRAAQMFMDGMPPHAKVLDLGGGPGHMARRFMDHGAQVTLFDLPHVIDLVRPDLRDTQGLRLVAGDLTEGLPEGRYDGIYLGNVTNMLSEQENATLFHRTAQHLVPGGRVGIQVYLGEHSAASAVFRVMMGLFTSGGDAWPIARYEHWLAEAGLLAPVAYDLDEGSVYQLLCGQVA